MALRNRQEIEADKLKGVILSAEPADLEPGRFVLLTNWIPSTVNSIKKKRGVEALVSETIEPVVPDECE